jgi:hypothetical protein
MCTRHISPEDREIEAAWYIGAREPPTAEAERVLAYFRQEYWPNEERSANALKLAWRVVDSSAGIGQLMEEGLLTQSLDRVYYRFTDKGVQALGFRSNL